MAKDKFMFFQNFKAIADKLDDDMRLKFYDALTNYVFNDEEPTDVIISALVEAIKPSLDKVDGRRNNGGNHNPNGVNQHSKVGQSGQIRSKLVNSGQILSETETEEETETEIKEKEISNDISKKKITADSDLLKHEELKPKTKRFVKPTLEEIDKYCRSRGNNIDARKFFDYYESNGWKVGKNPMKSWEAAVRTWERSEYNTQDEYVPVGPKIADMSNFVRAKRLGEEND